MKTKAKKRVNVKAILANPAQRRELLVETIQATQAREGIKTTREQAERAYDKAQQLEKLTVGDLIKALQLMPADMEVMVCQSYGRFKRVTNLEEIEQAMNTVEVDLQGLGWLGPEQLHHVPDADVPARSGRHGSCCAS